MGFPPTTTKGSADANGVVTFNLVAPNIPITHSGVTATIGTIPAAGGGTGLTSPGSSGNVLTSNGSVWVSSPSTGVGVWASYTPTFVGLGTVTIQSAIWRQVNENIEIQAVVTTGTVTGSKMTMTLPAGKTTSTSLIVATPAGAGTSQSFGYFDRTVGSNSTPNTVLARPTDTVVYFGTYNVATNSLVEQTANLIVSNNEVLVIKLSVPAS